MEPTGWYTKKTKMEEPDDEDDDATDHDSVEEYTSTGSPSRSTANHSTMLKKLTPWNMYVLSEWTHYTTGHKFVDAFILLPSGLQREEHFTATVREGGKFLEVSVRWPDGLSSLDIITKVAENTAEREYDQTGKDADPRVVGLVVGGVTNSYMSLREVKSEPITRQHFIELPVQVQTHIELSNTVQTSASGSILHVRLNGLQNTYASGLKKTGKINKVAF